MWFEDLKDINDGKMIDSLPISLNHFRQYWIDIMNICENCGKETLVIFPHEFTIVQNPDEIEKDPSKIQIDTIKGQICLECLHEYEAHLVKMDKMTRHQIVKGQRKMYEEREDIDDHK